MTEHVLSVELTNLLQESRRKHPELKNAADKSHQYLKSLPNTSEAQLAADLVRKSDFANPFLLACETKNHKLVASGIIALQRLIVVNGLPDEKIGDVLRAFKSCITLGHDVQLKILQVLAPLSQNYSEELKGDLLASALQISSELQNAKSLALSSIATAALQQLIAAVFDKIVAEDEISIELQAVSEVPGEEGPVSVRVAAYDAYKVFYDLCSLADGGHAQLSNLSTISQNSVFELLETILANYKHVFSNHSELAHIVRTRLMHTIVSYLPGKTSFATTVRVIRVVHVLLKEHITILQSECEIVLGLLNYMLDPEAAPVWKRAICLEEFRALFTDTTLVLYIYGLFDDNGNEKNILKNTLASFVKLATEKPTLIGLGQQSTNPSANIRDTPAEQAALEAGAAVGIVGTTDSSANTGISVHGSLIKTALMDQFDKSEPPTIPDTYIYALVLNCLSNLSESVARFVLPLTVQNDGRSKKKSRVQELTEQDHNTTNDSDSSDNDDPRPRSHRSQSFRRRTVPLDPRVLESNSSYSRVIVLITLVSECWPALLATCSTFLNASLDVDFYRSLVRAIQKFTQVAGLLRLSTPRDALLTTLGKAAIPPNVRAMSVSSSKAQAVEGSSLFANARGLLSVDSLVGPASPLPNEKTRRSSLENNPVILSSRNLLCLRAFINVAIALGPTLDSAWSIIFETLQRGDALITIYSNKLSARTHSSTRNDGDNLGQNMGSEIAAVQAAAKRLLESTADYPNDAFIEVSKSLYSLLPGRQLGLTHGASSPMSTPSLSQGTQSYSNNSTGTMYSESQDQIFILKEISELMSYNVSRFLIFVRVEDCGWDDLVHEMTRFASNTALSSSSRTLAVETICRVAQKAANANVLEEPDQEGVIHGCVLEAFEKLIVALYRANSAEYDEDEHEVTMELHEIIMDGLHQVFEHRGDNVTEGWNIAFRILSTSFNDDHSLIARERRDLDDQLTEGELKRKKSDPRSRSLVKSAFASVQLICSDFLRSIPYSCLSHLFELLIRFAFQQDDLNISLTVITFYWKISDLLIEKIEEESREKRGNFHETGENITALTIEESASNGSEESLWLLILLHLTYIAVDKRPELRNGAIQTLSRIFEHYSEDVPETTWRFCTNVILFELIESNCELQRRLRSSDQDLGGVLYEWNQTTDAIFKAVSIFLSIRLSAFLGQRDFGNLWQKLMKVYEEFTSFGSHSINESVYASLATMLAKIEDTSKVDDHALDEAFALWKKRFPCQDQDTNKETENQKAYSAYTEAAKQIYRLRENTIDSSELTAMINGLARCVETSTISTYSSDVDNLTALQKQVLDLVSKFRTDLDQIPCTVVKLFARFIKLPSDSETISLDQVSPSFVALSKSSMSLLKSFLSSHSRTQQIFESDAFTEALRSLSISIKSKKSRNAQGKKPKLWEKATSMSISILDTNLSIFRAAKSNPDILSATWEQIVSIANGIIDTGPSYKTATSATAEDEEFDILSFRRIRGLIIPWLGNPNVLDGIRRSYASSLFKNSLMHLHEFEELQYFEGSPLKDLYSIRFGRTQDPEPNPRFRIAHACLEELVNLMTVHDQSLERVKLAQSVAPYMILRAAVPLKAYIADQPLRGRLPQPESERQELLIVIKNLRDLDIEPKAIPDTPNAQSDHKKHLHRLLPLLSKALRVAGQDREVLEGLAETIEVIGEEFGF